MKSWRTIIVDDEPLARLELKKLLNAFQQISVIGEADSVQSAEKEIENHRPDLLFLDIDLGVQTGFDLLEATDPTFQTIFVTAYDKYAIRAFEINALDYLLKPVHPERLRESIKRLENPLKSETNTKLDSTDKILITNHNLSKFISVNSVSIIEAKGDYTRVCTNDGFRGMTHQTMTKWNERLPKNLFLRVHRSYIVNINHIQRLEKNQAGSYIAVLADNIRIPVSRNYMKEIKSRFRMKK